VTGLGPIAQHGLIIDCPIEPSLRVGPKRRRIVDSLQIYIDSTVRCKDLPRQTGIAPEKTLAYATVAEECARAAQADLT
jgi:hypothetical protein